MKDKILRHPRGTFPLLCAYALERFGFWGMRSLLLLFLVDPFDQGGLGWSEEASIAFKGWYAGIVYVTPSLGGFLADRYWGERRSMLWGGFFLSLGIALLLWPSETALFASLPCIAVGNGFFKPSATSLVGRLYAAENPLRQKSYHYIYVTVLLGVFFAHLVCGWIQSRYGYVLSFSVAAAATASAFLIVLLTPRSWLQTYPREEKEKKEKAHNLSTIFSLCLIAIVFFTVQMQGGLVTIYTHKYTNRLLGSWEIPTLWFSSFGTLLGLLLTFVAAWWWSVLGKKKREPSFVIKLAVGFLAGGLSFLFIVAAALEMRNAPSLQSSFWWIVGFQLCFIMGKLTVTPILWSTVDALAPSKMRNFLMGLILVSVSLGNIVGGQAGQLLKYWDYSGTFFALALLCFSMGALLLFFRDKLVRRSVSESKG